MGRPQGVFEGDRFVLKQGSIAVVVKYVNCWEVHIKTNTGYEAVVSTNKLRSGDIKDHFVPSVQGIGYLGAKGRERICHEEAYSAWCKMLERAYDPACHKTQPTYIGCSVHLSWHNFSTFADWYETNHVVDYHLDKDLKCFGNKEYGPHTCTYVPRSINSFFKIGEKDNDLPLGVCYCAQSMNYRSAITRRYFDSEHEAQADYWESKEKKVLEIVKNHPEFKLLVTDHFEEFKLKHNV